MAQIKSKNIIELLNGNTVIIAAVICVANRQPIRTTEVDIVNRENERGHISTPAIAIIRTQLKLKLKDKLKSLSLTQPINKNGNTRVHFSVRTHYDYYYCYFACE